MEAHLSRFISCPPEYNCFCSGCEKEVFETFTTDDLFQNIELNRCVAIIRESETTVGMIKPQKPPIYD